MTDLLPPAPGPSAPYGSRARHFASVSTNRLIGEMQSRWDQLNDDPQVATLMAANEYCVYTFLVGLHERADRSVFEAAAALISSGDPRSQEQGLRLLGELGHPDKRPVFDETWRLIEPLVESANDPAVIRALLACYGRTLNPRALPHILRFVDHPDPTVRASVADEVLGCASPDGQADAAAALLALCGDGDPWVRSSAMWEVKEFLDAKEPRVAEALQRGLTDTDDMVREFAAEVITKPTDV